MSGVVSFYRTIFICVTLVQRILRHAPLLEHLGTYMVTNAA